MESCTSNANPPSSENTFSDDLFQVWLPYLSNNPIGYSRVNQ
ncbi:hypothetical protein MCC93_20720 [Morococcus cerebrosus]|uniref:Uncharacterized protein n=1 Tax=Morococcus cerebrosus TaxID=1056807 RepID=A0A0C1E3S0_9NEIS|nr:hypothetical protein MCC93_20720 [Morococcus cerebrosus]